MTVRGIGLQARREQVALPGRRVEARFSLDQGRPPARGGAEPRRRCPTARRSGPRRAPIGPHLDVASGRRARCGRRRLRPRMVDDRARERLLRVDARSGRVLAAIPFDGRVALDAGARDVWVLPWVASTGSASAVRCYASTRGPIGSWRASRWSPPPAVPCSGSASGLPAATSGCGARATLSACMDARGGSRCGSRSATAMAS